MKKEDLKFYIGMLLFAFLPILFSYMSNARTILDILVEDLLYLHFSIVLFLFLIKNMCQKKIAFLEINI